MPSKFGGIPIDSGSRFGGIPIAGGHDDYQALVEKLNNGFVAPDPTAGMSGYDKFMAGAGKSVHDTGQGIGELLGINNQADIARSRQLDGPLMNTGAGKWGDIAGQTA